jgi:hypothetical protein
MSSPVRSAGVAIQKPASQIAALLGRPSRFPEWNPDEIAVPLFPGPIR